MTNSHTARVRLRGMSLIYTSLAMIVLLGFASLGVDVARVQVAKTELRSSADAAARAGAHALRISVSAAQTAAQTIAAGNTADGTSVAIDVATDVEFGWWDITTRSFTVLTGSARSTANAVRVTTSRTTARGNAVPLTFAKVLGISTCDVSATATAYSAPGHMAQLIGVSGVTVQNNLFTGTYYSSSNTSPTHGSAGDGASVGSNAAITAFMNENVDDLILGPSGTHNLSIGGTIKTLTQAMSFPLPTTSVPSSGNFNINGTDYIAGGTYHVNNLRIKNGGVMQFTGPATVYISGTVDFDGDADILAYNRIPGNLKIYHTGTGSFGSSSANNCTIIADVYAPGMDFAMKNNASLYGRFIVRTLNAKNNLDFYYDHSLTPYYLNNSGGAISIVK